MKTSCVTRHQRFILIATITIFSLHLIFYSSTLLQANAVTEELQPDCNFKFLNDSNNERLRWDLMKKLLTIFEDLQVPYHLSEGSLLFLYR